MKYFFWLQYDCPSPVFKVAKTEEKKIGDKHQHGTTYTEDDVTELFPSLRDAVQKCYDDYNEGKGTNLQRPQDADIRSGMQKKTRSEK